MPAIYLLTVVHEVLSAAEFGVRCRYSRVDADWSHVEYQRGVRRSDQLYEVGLAGIHGATLRNICRDLDLGASAQMAHVQECGTRLSATSVEYALKAGMVPATAPRITMPSGVRHRMGLIAPMSRCTPVCCRMTEAAPLRMMK